MWIPVIIFIESAIFVCMKSRPHCLWKFFWKGTWWRGWNALKIIHFSVHKNATYAKYERNTSWKDKEQNNRIKHTKKIIIITASKPWQIGKITTAVITNLTIMKVTKLCKPIIHVHVYVVYDFYFFITNMKTRFYQWNQLQSRSWRTEWCWAHDWSSSLSILWTVLSEIHWLPSPCRDHLYVDK